MVAQEDIFGLDPELACDVEVAFLRNEVRCIRVIGVTDVVRERRDGNGAEHLAGEHVVPLGCIDQIDRPVHAHVLAFLPRPIGGVLVDDVEFFTRGGVVVANDVEMTLDGIGCNDRAVRKILGIALVVGARVLRIGAAREQGVLGDLPADAIDAAPAPDADHRLGLGRVHDEVSPVELWIVGRVGDIPHEEGLFESIRLHSVDGFPLFRASRRQQREHGEQRECASSETKAHRDNSYS